MSKSTVLRLPFVQKDNLSILNQVYFKRIFTNVQDITTKYEQIYN